jgi:hypothetical protein
MGTPETVDVDGAVKALQKLHDSTKYGGSHLEQALGKDGAKQLLQDMYNAQKAGVKTLSRQQFAAKLIKYGLSTAAAVGGTAYELLK